MKRKKPEEPKFFQYRIKYNAGSSQSALDNYHYFLACSAKEALSFHITIVEKKKLEMQTLSVEKYNPYSCKWEDKSFILNQEA
jgi:hypothetical protein